MEKRVLLFSMGAATHTWTRTMGSCVDIAVNLEHLRDYSRGPQERRCSESGLHKPLQDKFATDPIFSEMLTVAADELQEALNKVEHGVVVLCTWCMWGKHRSVAFIEVLHELLLGPRAAKLGPATIHVCHLNRPRWDPAFRRMHGMPPNKSFSFEAGLLSIRLQNNIPESSNPRASKNIVFLAAKRGSGYAISQQTADPPDTFFSDRVGCLERHGEDPFYATPGLSAASSSR